MNLRKTLCLYISLTIGLAGSLFAQNGYMDNALNYSRLIKEKTADGVYKLIGPYKVVGTPYLYGEKNKGDLFSPETKAYNIYLSYNTYNQEVEFYSASNPEKPLVREPGTVDSFLIHENIGLGIMRQMKLIYGSVLGSSEKAYFLELYAGPKYSVYKRYKSELGYVSTNYIQSELKQFDLIYDYFYKDNSKNELTRLKTNYSNIVKEFKKIKDITPVFTSDDFTKDQEMALRKAFQYLNQ
ncbi:MAG TPA: hypothetical protein PKC72_05340 [Chitinophagaceae bacterium]|nr:hypothetical protein [Chitinophagaceae bacterium]